MPGGKWLEPIAPLWPEGMSVPFAGAERKRRQRLKPEEQRRETREAVTPSGTSRAKIVLNTGGTGARLTAEGQKYGQ